MKPRAFLSLLPLVLVSCTPDVDVDDSAASGADLVAGPELDVSRAGGAEVVAVKELSDGKLLVVDNVGNIHKVDRDLKPVSFRPEWVPDQPAVYVVDDGASLLYVGWAQMAKVSPDGALVKSFSEDGIVSLPYKPGEHPNLASGQGDDGTVAMVVEETRNRVYRSPTTYFDMGPLDVSLATIDTATGEVTKKVRVTLPKSNGANGVRVRKLLPLQDGTFALVVSKTEYPAASPNMAGLPRTRFLLIKTKNDQVLPPVDLVIGSYDRAALSSIREETDGTLKFLFRGSIDVPAVVDNEVFEATLAPNAAAPTIMALGDAGAPKADGPLFALSCGPATARATTGIVSARSTLSNGRLSGIEVTKFAANGGAPEVSLIDKTNRCVRGVFPTASGLLFVSYWNTTEVGWSHKLLRVE